MFPRRRRCCVRVEAFDCRFFLVSFLQFALDRPCCWRCREPWPSSSRHAYFRNEHQNTHTRRERERHDNELFRRIIHNLFVLFFSCCAAPIGSILFKQQHAHFYIFIWMDLNVISFLLFSDTRALERERERERER